MPTVAKEFFYGELRNNPRYGKVTPFHVHLGVAPKSAMVSLAKSARKDLRVEQGGLMEVRPATPEELSAELAMLGMSLEEAHAFWAMLTRKAHPRRRGGV